MLVVERWVVPDRLTARLSRFDRLMLSRTGNSATGNLRAWITRQAPLVLLAVVILSAGQSPEQLAEAQVIGPPPPVNSDGAAAAYHPTSSEHAAETGQPQILDECQVIARIDGQVVLACDVLWEVNLYLSDKLDQIPPDELDEIRRRLMLQQLRGLIDRKLLYAEFRRTVPAENIPRVEESIEQAFAETELPQLMKTLKAKNLQDLEKKIYKLGGSLDAARRSFSERAIAGSWVRERVDVDEEVTHIDMLEYYQDHLADYEFPTQVRWEELTVRKRRFDSVQEAYAAIVAMGNEVLAKNPAPPYVNGPILAEVAKAKSHGFTAKEGGLHDWTTKGALKADEVDKALFTLPVGQHSRILQSDDSFYIVRVLERKEAGRKPFTEVQAEIREMLKQERFRTAIEQYVSKLRRDARIWTIYTGNVSAEALLKPPRDSARR